MHTKYNTIPLSGSVGRRAEETQAASTDKDHSIDVDSSSKTEGHAQRRQMTVAVEDNSEYVRRAYQELYKTLDGNTLPTTSFLAYKPSADEPFVVFKADSETGSVSLVPVTLGSKPRIFWLMLFSFLLPSIAGIVFVIKLVLWYRSTIEYHRIEMAVNELARRKLLHTAFDIVEEEVGGRSRDDDPNDHTDLSLLKMVTPAETAAIVHKTSFYHFVEMCIVDPKKMKSHQILIMVTSVQILSILCIAAPLFIFSSLYNTAHLQYVCPDAIDLVGCQAHTPLLARLRFCSLPLWDPETCVFDFPLMQSLV